MQINIENDKQDKLQTLDRNIINAEQQLNIWQESNLKKFSLFKEKVTECLKYIETDKQAREYEHEVQLRELEALEKSIQDKLNSEKQARKDMETRLMQQIEDKFMAVRKTLSTESRNRYESVEQLKSSLENDMPRLQEIITQE